MGAEPPNAKHLQMIAYKNDLKGNESVATRGHMSPIAISPAGTMSDYHYVVIRIMTSFATELATPSVMGIRTYGHLTAFNTYKEDFRLNAR